jgi:hypothetical protein
MRLRVAALAALALIVACGRPPADDLTIEFSKSGEDVTVTADISLPLNPQTARAKERIDDARSAAIANTDPWTVRFARVTPNAEFTTMHRDHGVLDRVTRSVTIAPDDLQLVFSDANITVKSTRGDGWRDLAFYPGSSTRATREQQREFDRELAAWSRDVATYFRAVHQLYAYLDRQPQRAKWLFAAILSERNEDGSDPVVLEDEQPLVDAVTNAMADIADRMDAREGVAETIDEEADLLFNPFPARIIVRPPGTVLGSEGFEAPKGKDLVIEPIDLYTMIHSLEGKWISPDPLAALLRDEQVTAAQIAFAKRTSTAVVSELEIASEVRARLERPKVYRVRWRE